MDVSRICSELVAIRSENPPGSTAEVIEYIRTFLDTLGIGSKITLTKTGENNLITTGTATGSSSVAMWTSYPHWMKGGHTPLFRNHPGRFCVGAGCHGHERRVCLAACLLPDAG